MCWGGKPAVEESQAVSRPPRRSEKYKPLHQASDHELFVLHPNVIGVIDNTGRSSYNPNYTTPAMVDEPMVLCADGAVRRYPPMPRTELESYVEQLKMGFAYDVPSHLVTQRIGGFEVLADNSQAVFMVDGHPVSPIKMGGFEAYSLPNGRFMVPQPGFKDCANACELMLLLDHGMLSADAAHDYVQPNLGLRRAMDEIMMVLEERRGVEPLFVRHDFSYESGQEDARANAWMDLARGINEMGPCVLSKGGHVVMLDNVREENGQIYLSIRDPFHGTSLEFRESNEFFAMPSGTREDVSLKAIFLGKPGG